MRPGHTIWLDAKGVGPPLPAASRQGFPSHAHHSCSTPRSHSSTAPSIPPPSKRHARPLLQPTSPDLPPAPLPSSLLMLLLVESRLQSFSPIAGLPRLIVSPMAIAKKKACCENPTEPTDLTASRVSILCLMINLPFPRFSPELQPERIRGSALPPPAPTVSHVVPRRPHPRHPSGKLSALPLRE